MRNLTIRSLEEEIEAFARNTLTVKSACFWLTTEEIFLNRWSIENIEGKACYKKAKITRKERQQIVCLFCSQLESFFFYRQRGQTVQNGNNWKKSRNKS